MCNFYTTQTELKQYYCFQTGLPLAEKTDSPAPKHKILFVGLDTRDLNTKFLKINQPSCNIFKCLCFETHSAVGIQVEEMKQQ